MCFKYVFLITSSFKHHVSYPAMWVKVLMHEPPVTNTPVDSFHDRNVSYCTWVCNRYITQSVWFSMRLLCRQMMHIYASWWCMMHDDALCIMMLYINITSSGIKLACVELIRKTSYVYILNQICVTVYVVVPQNICVS